MGTTDTVVDTTVDTVDTTAVDTDTTVAGGLLMPNLKPKLPLLPPLKLMPMLTTDTVDTTAVDTTATAIDTDTVDTTDTLTDTDTTEARGPLMPNLKPGDTVDTIMVELLLKQTNKPLKLQLSGSSHSKFFQFGYNAKTPSPLIFF